jgi:hypothetical protein
MNFLSDSVENSRPTPIRGTIIYTTLRERYFRIKHRKSTSYRESLIWAITLDFREILWFVEGLVEAAETARIGAADASFIISSLESSFSPES